MGEQLSFGFGDPAPAALANKSRRKGEKPPYALYFSLFPVPDEADYLARSVEPLLQAHGLTGKPLPSHALHVTLHELGDHDEQPHDMVKAAIRAGDALAGDALEVVFDCALSYPGSNAYVLSGREGARQLTAFREELGESMRSQGLRVKGSFTPHMTLVYDSRVVAEHPIDPLRWTAREFVLIRRHKGQGVYDVLGRWPLKG